MINLSSVKGGQGVEQEGLIIWTAHLIAESSDFHPATCTAMGSSDLQACLTAVSSSRVLSILASPAPFSAPSCSAPCAQEELPHPLSICSQCCQAQQARAGGRSSLHAFTPETAEPHLVVVVGSLFVPRVREQLCS